MVFQVNGAQNAFATKVVKYTSVNTRN